MNGRRWATRGGPLPMFSLFRRLESFAGPVQYHGSRSEIQVSQLRNDHVRIARRGFARPNNGLARNDDFDSTTTLGVRRLSPFDRTSMARQCRRGHS